MYLQATAICLYLSLNPPPHIPQEVKKSVQWRGREKEEKLYEVESAEYSLPPSPGPEPPGVCVSVCVCVFVSLLAALDIRVSVSAHESHVSTNQSSS